MESAFLYLGMTMAVILIWFLLLKRPIYEAILVSFLLLLTVGGKWGNVWTYITSGMTTSLLYSMTVFVAMSIVLTQTKIIDGAVSVIIALLGRMRGGAGYAAVMASGFMGALSGSGPGNVMVTGSITVPAMKRSGFSSELAANVCCASSCLGNMIPPSSTIVASLGLLTGLYPEMNISAGQFWLACWGCSLWFILLRLVMVFMFCRKYHVQPMKEQEIPSLKETLRTGWRGLFLPVIIFLPFLLDFLLKDGFLTERLGAPGAGYFSSSLLYFIAGVVVIYAMIVARDKTQVTLPALAAAFGKKIRSIVPIIAICLFGYMFGALYNDLNVCTGLENALETLKLGRLGLCLLVPLITCVLGVAIIGSSMVVVFGAMFITVFAAAGVQPILIAAMLPCICGVMSNMVPPIAPAFLASVSISEADFGKTVKNSLWWIVTQYLLEVVILMGWLPILGM